MSNETVQGLACPRCGGMVTVPEGQVLVICPYCDQRSVVSAEKESPRLPDAQPAVLPPSSAPAGSMPEIKLPGASAGTPVGGMSEMQLSGASAIQPAVPAQDAVATTSKPTDEYNRGIRRYQVPLRANKDQLEAAFRNFVSGKVQVARDCAAKAEISEVFLVHLPFWAVWGRGVAWAFGQEKVGSGDDARYEPREKRAISELSWNAPACEVGDFGIQRVSLEGRPVEPFNAPELHRSGMVFEPIGSANTAIESARGQFESQIKGKVSLDRMEQTFVRLTNTRLGLVYYPLWVLRYLYHKRSFQVVVDGFNGDILYGKAPGSVGYRSAMLVGGMGLGSVLVVDVPALVMLASSGDEDSPFMLAIGSFIIGAGMMYGAYRTFRHAEHYEYHRYKGTGAVSAGGNELTRMLTGNLSINSTNVEDFVKTIKRLQ